jgi:hypothetical protein
VLEPGMPVSPFTKDDFILPSCDETGTMVTSKTRLFDPALSRRRNLLKLEPVIRNQGSWAQVRLGELDVILLEAKALMTAAKSLAAQGVYCYDS